MVLLFKIICRLLAVLPARVTRGLGRFAGAVFYVLAGTKRRDAVEGLTHAFPDWSAARVRRTARRVFDVNGRFVAEVMQLAGGPKHNPLDAIRVDDLEMDSFRRTVEQHHGGIVLTAHINNYVYLAAWAARAFPLTVVAKTLKPPAFNEYVVSVWRRLGIEVHAQHGSYRSLLGAVKKGGVVGFIMDQNIPRPRGVFTTFFNRPACTTPGLAMLSAHTGVPVIPCFLLRESEGYRARFLPSIPPPPDRSRDTLQDYAQRYTSVIEDVIKAQPESWIWMHKRWKTKPEAGDRITRPDGTCCNA